MSGITIEDNPYELVYREAGLSTLKKAGKKEAEEIVRHLGLIYNTFGLVMKEFIRTVAHRFQETSQSNPQSTTVPKQAYAEEPFSVNEYHFSNEAPAQRMEKEELKIKVNSNIFGHFQSKEKEDRKQECLQVQKNGQIDFSLQNFAYNQQRRSNQSVKSQKSAVPQKKGAEMSKYFLSQFTRKEVPKNQSGSIRALNMNSNLRKNGPVAINEQQLQHQPESIQKNVRKQTVRNGGLQSQFSQFSFSNTVLNKNDDVRVLPGRAKKQREQYKGIVCGDCEKYYKVMGIGGAEMCECSSRHRSNLPLRRFEKNNFTQQLDID